MDCSPLNISYSFTTEQPRLTANITFILYTLFAMGCGTAFIIYKRKFAKIRESLQVTFNAGGDVPMALLACTVACQCTWATNLLGVVTAGVQVI